MDIYYIILLVASYSCITDAQKSCPNNGLPFDYQSCDPEVRSQCPAGFTCRLSTDNSTSSSVYLCCESASMTISDWMREKQLVPQIFAQSPYSIVESLRLAPVSSNLNFPPIHIGDELALLSFPSYLTGMVQSIRLDKMLEPGYIHVVTVIDPQFKPFAVLVNYNIIIGQPTQIVNVTNSQRFIAYLDNSTSMPRQDSYRSQYVVLVYYTPSQIQFEGATPQSMLIGSCTDAKCVFSNSPLSSKLNQPTAATLFYLTTRRTVFAADQSTDPSSYPNSSHPSSFISTIFVIFFIRLLFQ